VEFPTDAATFGMEDQYMVGAALMVKPIVKPAREGGDSLDVYLPGTSVPLFDDH
jgi:alpha-glucosidase (family GH31 glycosyl hydrolase)